MQKKINVVNDCRGYFSQETTETILESRGIKDVDEFLNPSLYKNLRPLDDLKNINEAADIIIEAMKRGDLIGIYADV